MIPNSRKRIDKQGGEADADAFPDDLTVDTEANVSVADTWGGHSVEEDPYAAYMNGGGGGGGGGDGGGFPPIGSPGAEPKIDPRTGAPMDNNQLVLPSIGSPMSNLGSPIHNRKPPPPIDPRSKFTWQAWHEEKECPRRLVVCPRRCGDW